LSNREKEALDKYRPLKKSVWDKGGNESLSLFESSFYRDSELELEESVPGMEEIFDTFKDRFQMMWKESESTLSRNQKLLEEEFSSVRDDFNQSFLAIGKLYGSDRFPEQVDVHLMMRPDPGFVGGRMISQKPPKILLESGVFDSKDRDQVSHLWLLLLHELTHACFESNKFFESLDVFLGKKQPLSHFLEKYPATKTPALATRRAIREMIINSIEYGSYVRGKFYPDYTGGPENGAALLKEFKDYFEKRSIKDEGGRRQSLLRGGQATYEYIAWKLEGVTRPYLENGKKMDEKFLDGVYNVLKDFPDNLLTDMETMNKKG
jgi:hypothetical protein